MRVFKNYSFNLKERILFKDTLGYIDKFVDTEHYPYDNIAFMLDNYLHANLFEKYSQLNKYQKDERIISSVSLNWPENANINVEKDDENIVKLLSTKIPRPFNFLAARIILNNMHWFENINLQPAIRDSFRPNAYTSDSCQSNRIEMLKQFDYGKKINVVKANIEVTKSDNELLDDTKVLDKLIKWFGKPYSRMFVVFDSNENLKDQKNMEETKRVIEGLQKKIVIPDDLKFDMNLKKDNSYSGLTALKDISPKKALTQAIKSFGYKYIGYSTFMYTCRKINENNHCFEIHIFVERFKGLGCNLEIKGINFEFNKINLEDITADSQEIIEKGFQAIFEQAAFIEEQLKDLLLEKFGKTPSWYVYN